MNPQQSLNTEVKKKLQIPAKPKLRNYEAYIYDMKNYAKENADKIFKDTDLFDIRFLWSFAKKSGANLCGLRPTKKDKRKICNRITKKDIYDSEISYSKAISSGKYGT